VESNPDVIADVRQLPYIAGVADAVFASHILEHLPLEDVIPTLKEWKRVLRPGGRLGIVGPDFDRADAEMAPLIWPGEPGRWEGAGHAWCSTGTATLELVREVFPDAQEVSIDEMVEWPLPSSAEWQFAIEA
jgi:predicted SAM-dependent methyltransferase